ncbi:MAG: CopD family protein [Burkholderiaceae bacterium]
MERIWLFLHVLAACVWIGGMFFAHYCLRPAVADLQPQQRAPLMLSTLGRFFAAVIAAIGVLWITGLAMLVPVGMSNAPVGWHLMLAIGTVMTLVFAWIRWRLYPRALNAAGVADLPAAASLLAGIRRLVVLNLALGVIAIGAVFLIN